MRYFETLVYAAGWAAGPAHLEGFVREVQRLALEWGVRAETVQPIAESDETTAVEPPRMLEALPSEGWWGDTAGAAP
jgi:hypothetical protein